MKKYKKDSVLIIGDLHLPFEHKHYMDFCKGIQDKVRCGTVVQIGDLCDNHSLSFKWDSDPDGLSPLDEITATRKKVKLWEKAFPQLFLCRGNHDRRADDHGKKVGIPSVCFKPFREIWELPDKWVDDFQFEIDGVKYFHGSGYRGDTAHMKAAQNSRQSCVIGHIHHLLEVGFTASEKDCIFGMCVGTGIDVKQYAFAYERLFPRKPIVGCGVVTDHGKNAQVFRMEL